jgi:hypothetical protein
MKFLSSIFSFDTLRSVGLPGHWKASMALLVAVLVGAELTARALMAPIGDSLWAYSQPATANAFEWYRGLANESRTPPVVAVGDSTGARNFDPDAFSAVSELGPAYSLARPGNFPKALRGNTLPLLEAGQPPNVVILLQWGGSFRDDPRVDQIERGALSAILEARQIGRTLATDYLYLARLFPARTFLIKHWVRGVPLVTPAGSGSFSPLQPGDGQVIEASVIAAPGEADVTFSNARRDVVRELVEIAKSRDFVIVAVIGPQRDPDSDPATDRHLRWLEDLQSSACEHLAVLDMRQFDAVDATDFKDNNHLYASAAARFSARLASRMDKLRLQDPTGRCSRV